MAVQNPQFAAPGSHQVVPVLKKPGSSRSTKGGLRWDEENLQYNEEHKTATQKITEAKTPYNHEFYTNPDPELLGLQNDLECIHAPTDDADLDDGQRTPQSPHATMDVESHFAAVHTAVSFHVEGGDGDAPVTPDKEAQKKAAFDRMRKEHYNMKAALMARVDDSDEDEDEG